MFTGDIVPILSKLLTGIQMYENDRSLFRVVRVETTKKMDHTASEDAESVDDLDDDTTVAEVTGPIEIGQGVAHTMNNMGASILRGSVLRPDGEKWIVQFSSGRKLRMTSDQVEAARKLFAKEVASLVGANMDRSDASSTGKLTAGASNTKVRKPVLPEGTTTEKHELHFEEEFQGAIPSTIVGIEFKNILDADMDEDIQVWESVLRDLSKKLIDEGVETSRQLHDMEQYGILVKNPVKKPAKTGSKE